MIYRRPIVYIPPYSYCDRVCARCAIDKTRCLLYQVEMDDYLHRVIDGEGEPAPEEAARRIVRRAEAAARSVEERARAVGVGGEAAARRAEGPPEAAVPESDPLLGKAEALVREGAAFLRERGEALGGEERARVRHALFLVPGKLERAARPAGDAFEEADAILQAQAAHRALGVVAEAAGAGELRARAQELRREIEARWLGRPSELLEPVRDGVWWGPLRDVTGTLRRLAGGR
jgi:hypothetical protein